MIENKLVFSESVWSRFCAFGASYLLGVLYKATLHGFAGASIATLIELRLLKGPELTASNVARYASIAFIIFFTIRTFMELLWRHISIGKEGIYISHAGWWNTKVSAEAIDTCTFDHIHMHTIIHIQYCQRKKLRLVLRPKNPEQRESVEHYCKEFGSKKAL